MKISDILRQKLSEMPFETPGLGETAWMANISQDGGAFLEPVSLKVLGRTKDGISRPRIVRLLDGRKGFWKDSSPFDESDDAEIVIQYLGRRMGIEMAQEYRIFDKELIKDGLLSLDAARKPGEHFIEMRTLQSRAGREVPGGPLPLGTVDGTVDRADPPSCLSGIWRKRVSLQIGRRLPCGFGASAPCGADSVWG